MAKDSLVDSPWPALLISEINGGVRLGIDGFGDVEGATLQGAASSSRTCSALRSHFEPMASGRSALSGPQMLPLLDFIWELGDTVVTGRDPRELLFGPNPLGFAVTCDGVRSTHGQEVALKAPYA
jgi:hypothetical protein